MRPIWKGPFVKAALYKAVVKQGQGTTGSRPVRTKSRASMILPTMVGACVHVHNGHQFVPLALTEEMIGRRLGEFVATTKPFSFRATNANKKLKK
jgi:small subunit ribosomal protein S19